MFLTGVAVAVQAQEKEKQSLKDLLYSGKLKKDSAGVIRKTDDLSKKIDTASKKEIKPVETNTKPANVQQENVVVQKMDTVANATTSGVVAPTTKTDSVANIATPANTAPPKSNAKLWKDYTDNLVKTLEEQVLKSKQIKKNTYFIIVDYEIGTDGQVTFGNVDASPENSFLQAQIRQILDSTPLRMNPSLDSNNQPKKLKRKGQFTVTKE